MIHVTECNARAGFRIYFRHLLSLLKKQKKNMISAELAPRELSERPEAPKETLMNCCDGAKQEGCPNEYSGNKSRQAVRYRRLGSLYSTQSTFNTSKSLLAVVEAASSRAARLTIAYGKPNSQLAYF